ncbi:MAG: hypothetical protein Q8T08_17355, partial [Ignavibacteria bacterium]|nr:hypothetical protein [Ignavibacteria bacterium]
MLNELIYQINFIIKLFIIMKLRLKSVFLLALISSSIYAYALSNHETDDVSFLKAVYEDQAVSVMRFLEKDKKYAKISDEVGATGLHFAARNNNTALCESLIEKGADVNAK